MLASRPLRPERAADPRRSMSSEDGGVRSVSSSGSTRRVRLSRSGPAGRATASFGAARVTRGRTRTAFLRTTLDLAARRVEALAVFAVLVLLATARLRPFELDLALLWARRLSLLRTRFAMAKIPFKCLTGFG